METNKPMRPLAQRVVYPWTYPVLHRSRKSWYIDFSILDPASGTMKRKKYMLNRYANIKARKEMARQKIMWIVEEIKNGWNPWVRAVTTREFTPWATVMTRYKEYLSVSGRKGLLKPKTVYDYLSRVRHPAAARLSVRPSALCRVPGLPLL